MPQRHEIRSYDYVNAPYDRVREALADDTAGVFRAATRAAASRAQSVAAALHVTVAGIEVGAEIDVTVGPVEDLPGGDASSRTSRIPIAWRAARHPAFFPLMTAELSIYPLTATETQLDFLGRYDPPMSVIGDAVNAVVGHRIAEASVHRFIADVAEYLRGRLRREKL
jgi:hypothetical protein